MSDRNTLAHFLHDAGLAVWFGGSLMGAVGVNGAAADVQDPAQAARVANAGWSRWTPVNAVAIGAHLVGGAQLLRANKGRVRVQKGVRSNTGVKLALTAGALGATAYSRVLGQKVIDAGTIPVDGDVQPISPEVAKAQKQLKALQWVIPGLTGAVLASSALHEEQQRPGQVLRGTLQGLPGRAAGVAVPTFERARDAATPALSKAAHSASSAYEKAVERASDTADKALDRVKDALPA